jgi:hypothetical protein
LSTRELEQLDMEVKTDVLQANIGRSSEDENYSAKPTNICLLSYFNQSIDKASAIQSDDDEDNEITIKRKVRRVTRHQVNEEQLIISDDLKLHNILHKRDVYESILRVRSPKIRSIVRQNDLQNSMFKTPKSTSKNVTPTEILTTNEQHKNYSTAIIDTEKLNLSSATDDNTLLTLNVKQTDIKDTSDLVTDYDITSEKESSQNIIWTPEDKTNNPKYLTDLSVVSVIKFCSDYCCYVRSVSEPVVIQNYIDDKVKTMFLKTKTAKQWRVLKVTDFNNLSNNDIILLLQDFCTPTSRKISTQILKQQQHLRVKN